MVKRVLTSIITLAVLMGVLVSCSGTSQVTAPTPEAETPDDNKSKKTEFQYKRDFIDFCLEVYGNNDTWAGFYVDNCVDIGQKYWNDLVLVIENRTGDYPDMDCALESTILFLGDYYDPRETWETTIRNGAKWKPYAWDTLSNQVEERCS